MNLKISNDWVADLRNMECRHVSELFVIGYEISEYSIKGKIKVIPLPLYKKLMNDNGGLRKKMIEAEQVFLSAWFDKQVAKDNKLLKTYFAV